MKDSKIDWIGEIPEDWGLRKGKTLFEVLTGKLDVNAEDLDGIYPFFTCSMQPKKINTYAFDCEALLVAGNGIVGYTQYYKGKFNAYQRTYVLHRFKEIEPKFLKHYVSVCLPIEVAPKSVGSVIQFIKLGDLLNFNIAKPKYEKQQKIASFLDDKCCKIDSLISNQHTQIEKLKEYKQSAITEAVTKGLDPTVPMKDSGVEWIGQIAADFSVCPIRAAFRIKKDIIGHEPNVVLSITQKGLRIKNINENEGQMAASYANYQIVNIGDFAMNHMDLLTGGIGIAECEGVTSPDYRVFVKKNPESNSRYFLYLFEMYYRNKIFYAFGQGAANIGRWRLPAQNFNTLTIPIPPVEKQKQIADFLDKKCFDIDSLISIKQQKIEKLQEYKKSLIYEYVTGKKEVV